MKLGLLAIFGKANLKSRTFFISVSSGVLAGLSAGRTRRYTYNHLLRDLPDGGPSPGRQEELVLPLRSHSVLRQLYHRPILVSYRRHHVARDKRGGHLGLEHQVRVTRSLEPQVQKILLTVSESVKRHFLQG